MTWISVETRLPKLDTIVMVCRRSDYDGAPIYSFGARVDDSEGWLWAVKSGHGSCINLEHDASWNDIEADDDYQVTHWQALSKPPYKSKPKPAKTSQGATAK